MFLVHQIHPTLVPNSRYTRYPRSARKLSTASIHAETGSRKISRWRDPSIHTEARWESNRCLDCNHPACAFKIGKAENRRHRRETGGSRRIKAATVDARCNVEIWSKPPDLWRIQFRDGFQFLLPWIIELNVSTRGRKALELLAPLRRSSASAVALATKMHESFILAEFRGAHRSGVFVVQG